MGFLSKLRGCFQIRWRHERPKTHDVKASALADSTENLAQSSENSPFQPSPVLDACLFQDNDALMPVANQPNNTDLPPLSNGWKLELEKFHQEINVWKKWKEDHPDQNWIRTMKNLIDEKSPFLEMLPDGTIPIHRMVKSLIYTCKKAADCILAKEDVFLFMQEVDEWLDIVSYAFNSGGAIEFGSQAWIVLDEIRQLIRAALDWSSRLVQSRWLSVQSQIQVYQTEFTEISKRFGIIFDIRLAEGLNGVTHKLESVALDIIISENNDITKQLELLKKQLGPCLIENESYNDLAKSSENSPFQTSPVPDTCLHQDNDTLTPVANQPNDTDLPPISNSQELELEKFRQEMGAWKKWKEDHPDQNWIRTVKDLIDEKSTLLEMLPDGMIPIRGMVKSLIYTCKKAADFALAKEDIFLFVQEIDKWLLIICAVDGGNELKDDVWEVLDEIRQLIGEVLRWSSRLQVVSSKWLRIQSQIQAYRQGFTEISTRFGVVSDIKLLQGLDGVAQKVESVAQDVKNILENNDTAKCLELLKKQLQPRLIENESYNDQEKHPCDPETRLEILQEINSWIKDMSELSQCFYWLSGAPGIGKSAITVSVAKNCRNLSILGAQFFINCNDAMTTDPRTLFPTICWRLCERFPRMVAVVMEEALCTQLTLVDDISEDQAVQLFVKAIEAAAATDLSRAVAIVIDALDETDTKCLRDMALIFSKVVADLPQNAKVFISSRAEDAITKPFNSLRPHKRVKSRYLGSEHSTTDILKFMEKGVKKILEDYQMDWDDLGDDMMKTLSSQASGLFIWAVTALNLLRDEIQHKGKACFEGLLDVLKTDGMNDINMLYLTILRRMCKANTWEYQCFHRIIGAILVLQTPLSIADIAGLLDLRERSNSQPADLLHLVCQYRTVLVNDTGDINDSVVPRVHRSFADFITSERAKEFHIGKSASHGELALRCIDQMYNLNFYKKVQKSFPMQLVYASVHWQTHLTRVVEPDKEEKNAYDMPDIPENDTQSLPVNPPGVVRAS